MAKQLIPSVLGESHPETTRSCEISVVWDAIYFVNMNNCLPQAGASDKRRFGLHSISN